MAGSASSTEDAVGRIALAWQEAGAPAPLPPTPWQPRCDVPSCLGLAFVEFRTRLGQRSVCFKHYETIRESAGIDRKHNRRRRR